MKRQPAAGSLEEVVIFATTVGAAEKDARYFWYKCEGCDWTNAGRKIKDWRATFLAWWEAGYFPSQREKYRHKPASAVSAKEVRRVIKENRWLLVGVRDDDAMAKWDQIFRRELQCSYMEAMKVLE